MRRIIHNSTAIAATLAFLIPQAISVQTALAQGVEAQPQDQARAAMSQQLAEELAAGLTPDMLVCTDGTAQPCADSLVMLTPGGVPVQVTLNGEIIITIDQAALDEAALAQGLVAAPSTADQPAAPTEPTPNQQQAQQPAQQQPAPQQQAQQPAQQQPAPQQQAQQQQPAEVQPDALAEALAQQQQPAEPATPKPAAGGGKITLSDSALGAERQAQQPEMFEILQAEVAEGMTDLNLTCVVGDTRPCPPGPGMLTPMGVTVNGDGMGKIVLAPADRQVNVIQADGTLGPRAPEQGLKATEAALEAAQETGPVTAAALAENIASQQAQVIEQQITQADARSSTQDFETGLRDALTAATESQASGKKDDNDLTKAILLGLGAVAASQVLGNDRQVALAAPDRVVVERADGSQEVIKDEMVLLRQPGSTVTTENFDDGSSRTIVTREDGSKVVTIRDAELRVLRRTLIAPDGKTTQLIDDSAGAAPVDVSTLPAPAPVNAGSGSMSEEQLRQALQREANIGRRFSLGQIRNIPEVRALVAPINIDAITFDTGSAAISPNQARQLAGLGNAIQQAIAANPREVYLIEGHTDTVGSNAMNLALSDRRAESVALALTEYFGVPPENLVVQGYGEQFLKVRAEGDIRANRRASVRRITDLLQTASN